LIGTLSGRSWRAYAWPFAFLVVATVAIGLLRGEFTGTSASHGSPAKTSTHATKAHPVHHAGTTYVVRAGDTIEAIASRKGTTTARILALNPKVSPTALFIGEKLRLP
jgi:LysM repeat protein